MMCRQLEIFFILVLVTVTTASVPSNPGRSINSDESVDSSGSRENNGRKPICRYADGCLINDNQRSPGGNNYCPKCKDPNAEYSTCKTSAVSCDDREPSFTGECVPGCSCKYGYVRSSKKDDTCIKESRCPKDKRCPCKNQYYSSCADQCPERCPDRNGPTTCPPPTTSCQPGCQCIAGYVLTNKGCILPSECPPFVCDAHPNEIYSECGEKCTPSCSSVLHQESMSCKFVDRCYPECLCKRGYVRDGSGTCVPQNKCCSCKGLNEEYLECGPFCEASCQDQNPTCSCTSCKSGCFCKLGFIRNGVECVSLNDCLTSPNA